MRACSHVVKPILGILSVLHDSCLTANRRAVHRCAQAPDLKGNPYSNANHEPQRIHVEDAAFEWFGELSYAVWHGPHLAPGEPAAERDLFGEVVLVRRLREAIQRLSPAIPEEARATIKRHLQVRFVRRPSP